MQNQSDFKILSLSSSSYRSLYKAEVLKELENYLKDKSKNNCIANYFNLITGTSIGGIIALALAYEIPAEEIAKIFDNKGQEIFKKQSCIAIFKKRIFYLSDGIFCGICSAAEFHSLCSNQSICEKFLYCIAAGAVLSRDQGDRSMSRTSKNGVF